jgi:hypothetical protein
VAAIFKTGQTVLLSEDGGRGRVVKVVTLGADSGAPDHYYAVVCEGSQYNVARLLHQDQLQRDAVGRKAPQVSDDLGGALPQGMPA